MRSQTPPNSDGRRRRLSDAELTPEQRAAVEARRAERQTPQDQDELARDIEAYRQEYPPVGDPALIEALAGPRRERERRGLSLTAMAARTGIDRATISKLETGKLANPTRRTRRGSALRGEDLSKILKPMLDPAFTAEGPFPEQESPPHAADHALIPTSHRSINQMRTRDRHGRISWDDPHNLTLPARRVNIAMPVLSIFFRRSRP
jgi:transcriptional regulator with XRE-family HTH domain